MKTDNSVLRKRTWRAALWLMSPVLQGVMTTFGNRMIRFQIAQTVNKTLGYS